MERTGAEVVSFEPNREVLDVAPLNPMNDAAMLDIIDVARRQVDQQLQTHLQLHERLLATARRTRQGAERGRRHTVPAGW